MRLPPLPTISDIIRLYRLSAAKRLSQNFILDMTLNHKIVKYAGDLTDYCVCEVGPGPGGITRAILEQDVKHLYVIEKDKRFFPGLKMLADASGRLTAYHGDVLRFNMDGLFPKDSTCEWFDSPPKLHIIGNLPFNVATPLIFKYMDSISSQTGAWSYGRTKLTLTFQKEVALRMVAGVDSVDRCRLSVDVQNLCHVKLKTVIPGRAFVPSPDVDVGLVHFVPRKVPQIELPYRLITKFNRHLFHYRQKMCKNSIATLFPEDLAVTLTREVLDTAGVFAEARSYQLSIQEIGRMCHAYKSICDRLPYIYNYDYRNPQTVKHYSSVKDIEEEFGIRESQNTNTGVS